MLSWISGIDQKKKVLFCSFRIELVAYISQPSITVTKHLRLSTSEGLWFQKFQTMITWSCYFGLGVGQYIMVRLHGRRGPTQPENKERNRKGLRNKVPYLVTSPFCPPFSHILWVPPLQKKCPWGLSKTQSRTWVSLWPTSSIMTKGQSQYMHVWCLVSLWEV